ncbi:hypothetical protein CPB86DRAFT_140198 [Serendipita vermifera]|nr:hypothetical protein CPB86DRAFT_140198 [Serendipita vermifera]
MKDLRKRNLDLDMDENQLRKEIESVLQLFKRPSPQSPTPYEELEADIPVGQGYFPSFENDYEGWEPLIIGTFDGHGLALLTRIGNTSKHIPPRGYEVTIHHINSDPNSSDEWIEIEPGNRTPIDNYVVEDDVNVICLRAPYYYLRKWVDRESLPPRQTAFPHEPDMIFEGEFYEIMNTRRKGRRRFILYFLESPE